MKTSTKVFLSALVFLVLMVAVAALTFRQATRPSPPVVLSDGTTVRLVAVSYGTNHVAGVTPIARALLRLPAPLRDAISRRLPNVIGQNSRQTTQPSLVVWLEHWGPPGPSRVQARALLRPAGGQVSGGSGYLSIWNQPTNAVALTQVEFTGFPRGVETLECVLFEADAAFKFSEAGSFPFANPARLKNPPATNWVAQPLPATAPAGDLSVTLMSFASGLGNSTTHKSTSDGRVEIIHEPAGPGEEPGALARVEFDSPRGTNETWIVFDADVADAAGNRIDATSRSDMTTRMRFSPVLWDEGQPWLLRLHLKRRAGFTPGELLVFSNVPLPAVGATNQFDRTNSVAGIETVLRHFIRRPDLTNNSWTGDQLSVLRIEHPRLGKSNQLDLVAITAQSGGTNFTFQGGSSWSDDYHEFNFRTLPAGITHLDLTFAVQRTRFAEFIVAPNWTTNEVILPRE